jgi:hypothetical protein
MSVIAQNIGVVGVAAKVGDAQQARRALVVAAGVLMVAAVALNWWLWSRDVYLRKQPVPMRQKFSDVMPEALGNWARVLDDVLDPDVEHALAAYDYLFCTYINATLVGKKTDDLLAEFKQLKDYDAKRQRVMQYSRQYPHAVVRLGLSYYTGKADTVAHIPERCFIAEGFDPVEATTERWEMGGRALETRYIAFSDQRVRSAIPACNVAYFFHVNGTFMSDSLAVRRSLQNLFARYAYYAKVELRSDNTTREASAGSMKDLLAAALPQIEKALPDWSQYQGKR